eukprot:TRINITY_DN16561_c0_g1_i1.p1 TRINITY_DN16561_c0_g1~~TRINITY_DN16561_c0_g1_i1.p1  ORF type:complete len:629 (+),score=169.25 TRINITY_DN16561_c0_g1_i1:126-2012(+)
MLLDPLRPAPPSRQGSDVSWANLPETPHEDARPGLCVVRYTFWGGLPVSLPVQAGRKINIERMLLARMSVEGWRRALLKERTAELVGSLVHDFYWLIFLIALKHVDLEKLMLKYVAEEEAREGDKQRRNRAGSPQREGRGAKGSSPHAPSGKDGLGNVEGHCFLPPIGPLPQHLSPTASPSGTPRLPYCEDSLLLTSPYFRPSGAFEGNDPDTVAREKDLILQRMSGTFHAIFQSCDSTARRDALFRVLPTLVAGTLISIFEITIPYAKVVIGTDQFHELVDRTVSYYISGIERLTGPRRPAVNDAAGQATGWKRVKKKRYNKFQKAALTCITMRRFSRGTDGILSTLARGTASSTSPTSPSLPPLKPTAPSGGVCGSGGALRSSVFPAGEPGGAKPGLAAHASQNALRNAERAQRHRPPAAHSQEARNELKAELLTLKKQIIAVFAKQAGDGKEGKYPQLPQHQEKAPSHEQVAEAAPSAEAADAPPVSEFSHYVASRTREEEMSWYERGKRKALTQPRFAKGAFSLSQRSPLFGRFTEEQGVGNHLPEVHMTWVQQPHAPSPPHAGAPRRRLRRLSPSPSRKAVRDKMTVAPTPPPRGMDQWRLLMGVGPPQAPRLGETNGTAKRR